MSYIDNIVTGEEREKLYNEVWSEPVITVAKRYNISDNGLRKRCKKLGIPLPTAGYWAKVYAGQTIEKPSLPKVSGDLRRYVRNYVIKYKKDIKEYSDTELKSAEDLYLLTDSTQDFINHICSRIEVKKTLHDPHHLIIEHKDQSLLRKKRIKDSKSFYGTQTSYEEKSILPIFVSEQNINRAYRILDILIKTIEEMEGFCNTTIEKGQDKGYIGIMKTFFFFELKEFSKKKGIDDSKFIFIISVKGWLYDNEVYHSEYKDKDNEPIENQLGCIIRDMFVTANKLLITDELEEREKERKRLEIERQQRLDALRNGELADVKVLTQAASDWDRAQKIRQFVDILESQICIINDDEQRKKVIDWVKWARDKADWLDPLIEKGDNLLGSSKHIFDIINDMKLD